MKAFFKNCIFCNEPLPPIENRGDGDHVIPDLILGSFKFKDTCVSCNNFFGRNEKHLLSDPHIANAIKQLGANPLIKKVRKAGRYKAITNDGTPFDSVFQNGRFKLLPIENDETITLPTDDAIKSLFRRFPFLASLPNIEEKIASLSEGEHFVLPNTPFSVRNVKIVSIEQLTDPSRSAFYLLAKAFYTCMHIFLDESRRKIILSLLNEVLRVLDRKVGLASLDPLFASGTFCYTPGFSPNEVMQNVAQPAHGLKLTIDEFGVAFFDMHLFGQIGYRVVMLNKIDYLHVDNEELSQVGILMRTDVPQKLVLRKPVGGRASLYIADDL